MREFYVDRTYVEKGKEPWCRLRLTHDRKMAKICANKNWFRKNGVWFCKDEIQVKNHIAVERLTEKFGSNELTPHGMVNVQLNGQWLTPERGAPVRVVVPEGYGFKSIKWLSHVYLSNLAHANDTRS